MDAAFAENNICDIVSFHRKKIFCGKDEIAVEYIERGDPYTLQCFILKYPILLLFLELMVVSEVISSKKKEIYFS